MTLSADRKVCITISYGKPFHADKSVGRKGCADNHVGKGKQGPRRHPDISVGGRHVADRSVGG